MRSLSVLDGIALSELAVADVLPAAPTLAERWPGVPEWEAALLDQGGWEPAAAPRRTWADIVRIGKGES